MAYSELRGKMVINSDCPALPLGGRDGFVLEPVHASWRFPAARDDDRREHLHDVFHLIAVSEGRGSFLIGGVDRAVDGPCFALVGPSVPHVFSTRAVDRLEYHEFTFALRGADAPDDWKTLLAAMAPPTGPEAGQETDLSPSANVPLFVALDEDALALAGTLVKGIARILLDRSTGTFFPQYARMLFACVAERIAAIGPGVEAEEAADPVERARGYLELRYAERFDLARLAKAAGLSGKHLCRAFAKRYGTTPFRMKRNLAMKSAERLLVSTRYPIKAIAAAVGYEDIFHFSKAFKAWSGLPPGRFRARTMHGAGRPEAVAVAAYSLAAKALP